ncbi:hypothetical protein EYF80_059447 [Liparis tanakae]|uniref:Uncharacterized protein n=1 Tax=Liparis tanakae TaxID=230148 RepID=A0A4Z2EPC6_9TELE|nr:hypothetical protein EYF80_059447 [Liparis tanakae]
MERFVFVIGTSVVLAFRSMQRRGVGRRQLLRKMSWRTVVLEPPRFTRQPDAVQMRREEAGPPGPTGPAHISHPRC